MTRETSQPVVSILLLSWNTADLTERALDALQAADADPGTRYPREVLVLDNASSDDSAERLRKRADIDLHLNDENVGYARGNNQLAHKARGDYLCLLGSDTRVEPGAIDALVAFLEANPEYGAAAPQLRSPDGSVQRACMRWPTRRVALVYDMCWRRWPILRSIDDRYFYRDFDHEADADVEQPPATCLVLRRELWQELDGFDERLWLFFNDVDLCRRIHARGLRIRFVASARVEHELGASTAGFGGRVQRWARDRIAYYHKHYGRLGRLLVRTMIRLRAYQEWWTLGRRHKDPKSRRDARRELKTIVREALTTPPTPGSS